MVSRTNIESTLNQLENLYNNSTSPKKLVYYSKLAIIELCGWIEETLDTIVITHANRTLKESVNKKFVRKSIVQRNYGFQYDDNVRQMLMKVIGLIMLERIERRLERTGQVTVLASHLNSLKTIRNTAAHTYLKGTTTTFQSPSVTKGLFSQIYPILVNLDAELRI